MLTHPEHTLSSEASPETELGLRASLIDAARRILDTRGITALTTREIAREAGCSEGALYTHFPAKGDLVFAVCMERLPLVRRFLGDLMPRIGAQSVERNLVDIVRAAQRFYEELVPIASAVGADADLRIRHQELARTHAIGPRQTLEAVAGYIAAEQRIGRVHPNVDAEVAAGLLLGACFADASVKRTFGTALLDGNEESTAKRIAATLWAGLAPAAGGPST